MALAWVRFVPWALTLITCGLNIAAGHSLSAKVAHGTMPMLWVVFSEIGAHVYAVRIGAATAAAWKRSGSPDGCWRRCRRSRCGGA
ncbi:hypothetical protein [Streptomyces sp. R08]|uniref:Uncharacterized protein n=1 Tax=Streptomyces sp. R08 TaxID=3238624 RepID=A0AB39MS49_9ACTN